MLLYSREAKAVPRAYRYRGFTIDHVNKARRKGPREIETRRAAAAVAAGAASAAILMFITRGMGPYSCFTSILGGVLVTVLSCGSRVLDGTPFPSASGPAAPGRVRSWGKTPLLLIVLALFALLSILLFLFASSPGRGGGAPALFSPPMPAFVFALAVFFLCLAGDLALPRDPASRAASGIAGRLWSLCADFSRSFCSLSIYIMLVLLVLRIAFPARISVWDPLVEMSLAQVAGSAAAWTLDVRREQSGGAAEATGDGAEVVQDG